MAKYIVVHGIKIAKDFVPETFGRLTTIGPKFRLSCDRRVVTKQVCLCACGDCCVYLVGAIRNGNTRSCGCLQKEEVRHRMTTHGLSKTPEYKAWRHMLDRCYNPDNPQYKDWGGRGIGVWDTWRGPGGFELWLAEIGPRPSKGMTQDRFPDPNGDYAPGNVRWATGTEQCNNKTNNHVLTFLGKTQTVAEWSQETGIAYQTLQSRIRLGWSVDRMLSAPVRKLKPKQITNNA